MQAGGGAPLLRRRTWLIFAVAAATVALDQVSKLLARRSLESRDVTLIPGVLRLSLATNTGGAFGLFRSGRVFFIAAGLILLAAILFFARRATTRLAAIAVGLMLGGALANLADRIFAQSGRVTDFIEFRFWPTFNLADAAIVVGTGLALVALWRPREGSDATAAPGDVSEPAVEATSGDAET